MKKVQIIKIVCDSLITKSIFELKTFVNEELIKNSETIEKIQLALKKTVKEIVKTKMFEKSYNEFYRIFGLKYDEIK